MFSNSSTAFPARNASLACHDLRKFNKGSGTRVKYTVADRVLYISAVDFAFGDLEHAGLNPTLADAIRHALTTLQTASGDVTRLSTATRKWYKARVIIGHDTLVTVIAATLQAKPRTAWFPAAETRLLEAIRAMRRTGCA